MADRRLHRNRPDIKHHDRMYSVSQALPDEPRIGVPSRRRLRPGDYFQQHKFFYKHADKLDTEVYQNSKPAITGVDYGASKLF